jgi:Peptidase family M48
MAGAHCARMRFERPTHRRKAANLFNPDDRATWAAPSMRAAMKAALGWALVLLGAVSLFGAVPQDQGGCQPPSVPAAAPGLNIFTEQQEMDLGDLFAERLPHYIRVSDDPAVTTGLARIGERLVQHLPSPRFPFRYFLVDSGTPEAFSIAGGRIYVSRGMIASARSEDELASVMAHEMGHIVTHQSAIDMTTLLREVLGVTVVSDRQDILRKFDTLEENWRRNPAPFRRLARRGFEEQLAADQVGLYATVAAGYSPQSFVDVFDRTAQTGGRTGGWLSDFLGSTTPEQRRLREMLKSVEDLPQACVARRPLPSSEDFQKWRATVYSYSGWSQKTASLHDVLAKVKLEPWLGRNIRNLKFSPDGRHILAQVTDTLYVLTREPFAESFQIHAPDAWQAQFTADSKSIAFTVGTNRVEVWDLATRKRARVDEISVAKGCFTTLLAPDAKTVACLGPPETLTLIDLPAGTPVAEEKGFARQFGGPRLEFSQDGRYLLAANRHRVWAFDLQTRESLRLPSSLKQRLTDGFLFLGPDRVLVSLGLETSRVSTPLYVQGQTIWSDSYSAERRPPTLFTFPSGKVIGELPVGFSRLSAPAHGDYVLLHDLKDRPVSVMDLRTKKIFLQDRQSAFDICDDTFVRQLPNGDLGLYDTATRELRARAHLPVRPDTNVFLRALVSPGLKWLAASDGPIWDLSTGKRVFSLRSFQSGWFDGEDFLYADFPKEGDSPRAIARIDVNRREITGTLNLEEQQVSQRISQHGPLLVTEKPQQRSGLSAVLSPCNWRFPDYDPMDCDVLDEVSDLRTGRLLWSWHFPKDYPRLLFEGDEGRILVRWHASVDGVRDAIKVYPRLAKQLAAQKDRNGVYFVEVLDAWTGKALEAMLVDTGGEASIFTAGDRLIVSHNDYFEIYSLATGLWEGEIFGRARAYCKASSLISIAEDSANQFAVYDLSSRRQLDAFAFPSDVDFEQFSRDGKRLFVLTADQTAYILDLSHLTGPGDTKP